MSCSMIRRVAQAILILVILILRTPDSDDIDGGND